MKTLIIILNLIIASSAGASQLDKLLKEERFFELRTAYNSERNKLPQHRKLYFEAYLDNAFGRLSRSNGVIDSLLNKYAKKLKKSERIELLLLQADNHTKQFEYAMAAQSLQKTIKKAPAKYKADLKNSLELWGAMSNIPPQTVHHKLLTEVPITKNKFNHWTIPVSGQQKDTIEFVFDSGANLSTIRKSIATVMGVIYTGNTIKVGNSVGTTVQAEYGYIPRLWIGDLMIENVIVLVMPDSLLSFDQINYTIDGIIGFPVAQGFGEFSITRKGVLRISTEPTEHRPQNIFTKGLTPYIAVEHNGDSLTMVFDTGALSSHLSKRYYKTHKQYVDANSTSIKSEVSGAGKLKKVKNRRMVNVALTVASDQFALPALNVMRNKMLKSDKNDGFLGQDVLMQKEEIVINLRDMYLYFK